MLTKQKRNYQLLLMEAAKFLSNERLSILTKILCDAVDDAYERGKTDAVAASVANPTSAEKPFELDIGDGYKTRDGHEAVVVRIDADFYAYGAVMLKSGLHHSVWRIDTGGKIYSKAPKPHNHDIVSREAV